MIVRDPKAGRVLADPVARLYLQPFLTRPTSVRDAANELDSTLNAMLMRVRRFHRLGLLRVTHEHARAGRPVKYYQTVAEGFYLPYDTTTFESPEAWFTEEFTRREQHLTSSLVREALAWGARSGRREIGKRVFVGADGRLSGDFAFGPEVELNLSSPEAPAIAYTFAFMNLTHADAKTLQEEVLALARKYEGRTGSQPYGLRLALTPIVM